MIRSRVIPATVAICDGCWQREMGEQEPVRLKQPHAERLIMNEDGPLKTSRNGRKQIG